MKSDLRCKERTASRRSFLQLGVAGPAVLASGILGESFFATSARAASLPRGPFPKDAVIIDARSEGMPSLYTPESRSDPYDASMKNLAKARASERYHPPRPWRNKEESLMIRRFVLYWHTCRDKARPSARSWARQLGISHVWLLKVVRGLKEDPSEVRRLQAYGDPKFAELIRARECTREMKERGDLRLSRVEKWAKFLERYQTLEG